MRIKREVTAPRFKSTPEKGALLVELCLFVILLLSTAMGFFEFSRQSRAQILAMQVARQAGIMAVKTCSDPWTFERSMAGFIDPRIIGSGRPIWNNYAGWTDRRLNCLDQIRWRVTANIGASMQNVSLNLHLFYAEDGAGTAYTRCWAYPANDEDDLQPVADPSISTDCNPASNPEQFVMTSHWTYSSGGAQGTPNYSFIPQNAAGGVMASEDANATFFSTNLSGAPFIVVVESRVSGPDEGFLQKLGILSSDAYASIWL